MPVLQTYGEVFEGKGCLLADWNYRPSFAAAKNQKGTYDINQLDP
jgi:hypothetical protein